MTTQQPAHQTERKRVHHYPKHARRNDFFQWRTRSVSTHGSFWPLQPRHTRRSAAVWKWPWADSVCSPASLEWFGRCQTKPTHFYCKSPQQAVVFTYIIIIRRDSGAGNVFLSWVWHRLHCLAKIKRPISTYMIDLVSSNCKNSLQARAATMLLLSKVLKSQNMLNWIFKMASALFPLQNRYQLCCSADTCVHMDAVDVLHSQNTRHHIFIF